MSMSCFYLILLRWVISIIEATELFRPAEHGTLGTNYLFVLTWPLCTYRHWIVKVWKFKAENISLSTVCSKRLLVQKCPWPLCIHLTCLHSHGPVLLAGITCMVYAVKVTSADIPTTWLPPDHLTCVNSTWKVHAITVTAAGNLSTDVVVSHNSIATEYLPVSVDHYFMSYIQWFCVSVQLSVHHQQGTLLDWTRIIDIVSYIVATGFIVRLSVCCHLPADSGLWTAIMSG